MLRDQIADMLRHGCPREEVVSVLTAQGRNPDSIRKMLNAVDGPQPAPRMWTAADDRKVRELFGQGITLGEVAQRFPGRSVRSVEDRRRKLCGPIHPRAYGSRKRESKQVAREEQAMRDIDRRVELFDAADGSTRVQIGRRFPDWPADWIDAELAAMLRSVLGHPPILKLGRDGVYRKKDTVHSSTNCPGRSHKKAVA